MERLKKFYKKKRFRILLCLLLVPIALFFILNLIFPLRIHIQYSQLVTANDGSVLYAFLSSDDKWRLKTELNEITPLLKKTIIEKEDKYFYYHPGINPVAVVRAILNNVAEGRKTSGASTITMQVARMLEPKDRTYGNKMLEIFRAFQLELHHSKDEILQMYLNLVPYGSNIEGVKSASLIYFGQSPDYLSLAQIVTLSIIPNRPSSLAPGKNNALLVQERNRWLKKFQNEHLFPEEEILDALSENLTARRQNITRTAPHLSLRLASMYPNEPIIHSTLDKVKQQKAEKLAYNYIQRLHYMHITNCAVVVVNNQTHAVEAYVGSANFNSKEDGGQVDGVRAVRSPGSTLKPLLYSLAFDQGLITPKSVITDVPANFSGYEPENFDSKFHGSVTAKNALANSLNVPAVKLLDRLGIQAFLSQLKNGRFNQVVNDENKLGLSVVLGGCGVKLEELVQLYSCFANQGKFQRIKWTKEDIATEKFQLLSPAAAYMTTEILTDHMRPELPVNYESIMHIPKIAWKTGTSYGRRDAWSIGYNMKYTIGVWVGNFNGMGVPELTGADIATPLLIDIFNSIDYDSSNDWWRMPKGLDFRFVCSVTGKIPNEFCTDQVIDYFIPGVSSNERCDHLKEIFVSPNQSISYCRNCLPDKGYKKELFPNLAPELISFCESENIPYTKMPPHEPNCSRIYTENAPSITSPLNGIEYIFEEGENQQLMLACHADNEVKKVYWYINNKFYKAAGVNDHVFFRPSAGETKISCADDKGRNTNQVIKVTYLD